MENTLERTTWQKIKWWFNFITTIIMNSIIVILVLIGFLFLAYYIDVTKNVNSGHWEPPLFGAYVIVSPSMVPTIKVQDAILIKRTDDLKVGDICTYFSRNPKYPGKMITHRIVGTNIDSTGNKVYIFKGDNNYSADELAVSKDQIYGKVIMKIPKIGYIQYFLSQAYGWIIAIVVPCVGIITFDIMKLVKNMSTKKKKRYRDEK